MKESKSRIILTTIILGAVVGLGIGVVVAETKQERLQLANALGDEKVAVQPSLRDWISVAVTAVTMIRQLANMLAPKA